MKRVLWVLMVFVLVVQTACGSKISETSRGGQEKQTEVKIGILEKATQIEEEGALWKVSGVNIGRNYGSMGIHIFQDNLLVSEAGKLTLISLENGDTLHEVKIPNTYTSTVQICGDKIVVNDAVYGGLLRIYDSKLELIARYELEEEYYSVHLNANATKAFCLGEESELFLMELETGETEVLLEEASLHDIDESGDAISYVDGSNGSTYVLDCESDSVEEIPIPYTYWLIDQTEDRWLAQQAEDWNAYYIGDSTQYSSFTWKGEEFDADMAVVDGPASLYIGDERKDCERISLYDMEGKVVSQYTFPEEDWHVVAEPLWSEEAKGYFLIASSGLFGKTSLLFWDLEVPTKGKDLEVALTDAYGGDFETDGLQSCYDKAAELSQKYGVEIKIGEQCEVDYYNYRTSQITNPLTIQMALGELDKALSAYPQGFLQQLTYGEQQKTEISFVGELIKNSTSDYGAEAFVSHREGMNILIANIIAGNLEQTLYHEIMHLMDYRMEYDTATGKNNIYNEDAWKSLNPAEFSYKDSYEMIEDEAYEKAYSEWFVDSYAKTYTVEDRARIMENAMAGNVEVFEGKPHLIAKLEYLCQYIRNGFDTTGWPEKTVWEETLEKCR